ncbi:glutathione S-transferase family protein [Arenicella sp.]|nr:glutathione S-transferase family protein [Arenicella sp.]
MTQNYTLYGTDFSLYTGKARSYLIKKGIPFDEVLSTVSVYKKFIVPRTGVRYIPVLQTPDDQVYQDTTVIIDQLEDKFPQPAIYPSTPKQKLVSLLLETYGDEWLVIPAMYYRWNYQDVNQPFVFQNFGRVVAPYAPKFIRGWLGKKIANRFKSMLPSLGISEKTSAAIEQSYQQLLADLDTHFSEYEYLLGGRPSIADFGFIGPLYAHLYRDPFAGKFMQENAPSVCKWVERMNHSKITTEGFIEGDEIPDTLVPLIRRMVKEQLPVLLDTDECLVKWHKLNPNTQIPRSIGKHSFKIENVTGERVVLPYSLWMFQRSVDFYESLASVEKTQLETFLKDVGLLDALRDGLNNTLVRTDNRLKFAG